MPMISYLSGICIYKDEKRVIIDVHGIGYNVFTVNDILMEAEVGSNCTFWTYLAVRENALELFGFKTKSELDFFEMLITISGIGPRGALGIMSITNVETLTRAIATGDTSYLTKVSGIGKKTAEKIVIELRDKLSARTGTEEEYSLRGESDALEALQSLGYSQREARDALKNVPNSLTDTSARVKEALKNLSKN